MLIFPELHSNDNSTLEYKTKQRNEWKYGSITNNGKVIILTDKMLAYHNESTTACGATIYLNASMVPMDDRLRFKQEFHIIIQTHKDAIMASLSEHPCPIYK